MANKIVDFIRNRLEDFLPPEEPQTESERLFEEGKKRVYEMHQNESNLFYVDNIWIEGEKIQIYGEFARGDFPVGQGVDFLDNYGEWLFAGKIEDILEEKPQSVKVKRGFMKTTPKIHLIISCENISRIEDSFGFTNFLIEEKER